MLLELQCCGRSWNKDFHAKVPSPGWECVILSVKNADTSTLMRHTLSLCRAAGPCSWGGHEGLTDTSEESEVQPGSLHQDTSPWKFHDWNLILPCIGKCLCLGFKFSHLRNKISTLLLKSASIQLPACTCHHGAKIEGLESSGKGWMTKTKPNFDSLSPARKNEPNPQWDCAMYKQLLKLSQLVFSLGGGCEHRYRVPINSLLPFPLMTHRPHGAGMFICSRKLSWVLQLGCSSFSIAEGKKKTLAASPAAVSDSEMSCHSQEAIATLFQASLAVLGSHPLVKSLAGIKKGSKHAGDTTGRDVAQILPYWVTSSRGMSSISQGYFCALPARFLGLWPASSAGEWEAYHVSDFPGYAFSNCAGILPRWI